jgi:hypothetical protein
MSAFFIIPAVMTSDLKHTELVHTIFPKMPILITSLHLHLGNGIFLLLRISTQYSMYFLLRHETYVVPHPHDSAPSVKKPKGNWRLKTIYSESRHLSIPAASPLRETSSVYGIGAYSMWIPELVRASGDASIYCLQSVVSYEVHNHLSLILSN